MTYRRWLVGLAAAAAVTLGQAAHADLLVYEGFDYASDAELAGQTGGGGWASDPWVAQPTDGGTFMATGSTFNGVVSTGRSWRQDDHDAPDHAERNMADTYGIVDGAATHSTLWNSVILVHGKNSFTYDYRLTDASGTSVLRYVLNQQQDVPESYKVRATVDGSTYQSSVSGFTGAYHFNPHFLLAKMDFAPGGQTDVTIWFFAAGGTVPATEAGLDAAASDKAVFTDVADFSFNRLFFNNGYWEPSQIDEIRVATTFSDAVSGTEVPEPGSLVLAAGGAALLLLRKRRS